MKKSKTIIIMIALISIICISLVACNANPKINYEKVKLTQENIYDYLSFQKYILQGNLNPIAHVETSKKQNVQFENVYFRVDEFYSASPVDVNWDGYSHFCRQVANASDIPTITITEVEGFVLVPR